MKCHNCKNEALPGRANCQECLIEARESSRTQRHALIKAGLCASCGKVPPIKESTKCQSCFDKHSQRNRAAVKKCKDNGECPRCRRSLSFMLCWTNRYCAYCHLRYKLKYISNSKEDAEKIINDMLIKQDFKCALSGRDLKTSRYHIDHIIPRSKRPDLLSDPTNWQLITEEVNMFKSTLSVEEVIRLALDIANFRGKNNE